MRFDVLTLFPDMIRQLEDYGVIGKALETGRIELGIHNIRDYTEDKHKKVDDTVYGGAAGMLMTAQPIVDCLEAVAGEESHIIYLSPQGRPLDQKRVLELSKMKHLVLLCGHYEGIDARVTNHYIDEEISIGDFIVTGGELPAMILLDAVARWLPHVLGNAESAPTDSFASGLLQHDVYTKPRNFRGWSVPEVLLSGHHEKIEEWRQASRLENTKKKRPDLYEAYKKKIEDEKS